MTEENKKAEEKAKTATSVPNNIPYVVAVVIMIFMAITGVVLVSVLRPNEDNTFLITSILGFTAPTTLSLLTFMKAQETHLSVNSRLEDFIKNAGEAKKAEGIIEGQQIANDRTDAIAKK